jgi:molecular chaperone GrpE
LSSESNSDEVPVNVVSENQVESNSNESIKEPKKNIEINDFPEESESSQTHIEELTKLLDLEKQKVIESDEKLKHVLADFQNMNRKTQSDIENGVNVKIDEFVLDFLKIYDDFVRAKVVFSENKINADGLDSILKNMDSLLKKYQVIPIDALGEIFDPNSHEAISVITDPNLDDNTITKEIRKGYISQKRVIRPTLVEISKKG